MAGSLNGRLDRLEAAIDAGADQRCAVCQPLEVVRVTIDDPEPEPLAPCLAEYGCAFEPRRLIVRVVPGGDAGRAWVAQQRAEGQDA